MNLEPEPKFPIWLLGIIIIVIIAVGGGAWWWLSQPNGEMAQTEPQASNPPAATESDTIGASLDKAAIDLDANLKEVDASLSDLNSVDANEDTTPSL